MKVRYEGASNTACTRPLAFMSESGLMPDRVQIKRTGELWTMLLVWDADTLEDEMLGEIEYHCRSYGLKQVT